jgi:glycogen synthase
MHLLRSRVPRIRCVIGGRGSYLPELQSQIDLEGVSDVIELPGFLPDDQLRDTVHRAGCVVIPSLYEPFGIVALEALAGGAPLVVARTGGLAELVEDTGAGLLFEPGNAAELASCIELVLSDETLAAEMRKQGAELLADRYSWQAIAGATASVYAGHPSAP